MGQLKYSLLLFFVSAGIAFSVTSSSLAQEHKLGSGGSDRVVRLQSVPFALYDSTEFTNKTALRAKGVQATDMVYEQRLWTSQDCAAYGADYLRCRRELMPKLSTIQSSARVSRSMRAPVILDIETPYNTYEFNANATPAQRAAESQRVATNLDKMLTIFQQYKQAAGNPPTCYYNYAPLPDRTRSILSPTGYDYGPNHTGPYYNNNGYLAWQYITNRMMPVVSQFDMLCPAPYTEPYTMTSNTPIDIHTIHNPSHAADLASVKERWVKSATAIFKEARRVSNGKKVYAVLWWQFLGNEPGQADVYVGDDLWKTQLELAFQHADGIIFWGGYDPVTNRPEPWDENAAWWQVTKQFIDEKVAPRNRGSSPLAAPSAVDIPLPTAPSPVDVPVPATTETKVDVIKIEVGVSAIAPAATVAPAATIAPAATVAPAATIEPVKGLPPVSGVEQEPSKDKSVKLVPAVRRNDDSASVYTQTPKVTRY